MLAGKHRERCWCVLELECLRYRHSQNALSASSRMRERARARNGPLLRVRGADEEVPVVLGARRSCNGDDSPPVRHEGKRDGGGFVAADGVQRGRDALWGSSSNPLEQACTVFDRRTAELPDEREIRLACGADHAHAKVPHMLQDAVAHGASRTVQQSCLARLRAGDVQQLSGSCADQQEICCIGKTERGLGARRVRRTRAGRRRGRGPHVVTRTCRRLPAAVPACPEWRSDSI